MCGRYGFIPPHDFYERFNVQKTVDLKANYNTAPGQVMPVITTNSPKTVQEMKWGLIPFWSKDPRIGYKMINARSEGIQDKPSFRGPMKNKRCLVPASLFYEWKRDGKDKTPYAIRLKKRDIFVFAGLYNVWKDAEGRETKSYTIITTEPNPTMAKIHDRMPVILEQADEDTWVNNDTYDLHKLIPLLRPTKEDMEAYIVSDRVNSPANNDPTIIESL